MTPAGKLKCYFLVTQHIQEFSSKKYLPEADKDKVKYLWPR